MSYSPNTPPPPQPPKKKKIHVNSKVLEFGELSRLEGSNGVSVILLNWKDPI